MKSVEKSFYRLQQSYDFTAN